MKFCFFLEGLGIRVCMCIYIKKKNDTYIHFVLPIQ